MSTSTFNPTSATFVHEIRIRDRWQQEYACPSSRPDRAPHRLHLDKSGKVIGCSCEGFFYAKRGRERCKHTEQAAAIVEAATLAQLAALDDAALTALATKQRAIYGTEGLADNLRADLVADELAARLAQRYGIVTITRSTMAADELFSEAGD